MSSLYTKETASLTGQKSITGAEISDEMLTQINKFALEPLQKEDVFVRKQILAHSAVDRDNDRFPDELLDDFKNTTPGKSFLFAHEKRTLPMGLYFKAETEVLSSEKFTELTGESPVLGVDQTEIKVLWAWFYMIKDAGHDNEIKNINGGVYRHVSIGFAAKDINPIKGDYDQTLYWEYSGPGEMREGSLVWLGAQTGASTQKSAKVKKENNEMTIFKNLTGMFGKSIDDKNVEEEVSSLISAKDTEIDSLKTQVGDLQPMADVGKVYIDNLSSDYARMKTLLGEADEKEETKAELVKFASSIPVKFLEAEVKGLQKRVEEKFPSESQLEGDNEDKREGGKADDNPLIPKDLN